MIELKNGKAVCAYCGGTGETMIEYYSQEREQVIQEYQKCLCQLPGTDEYEERIDCELREQAGLQYTGKNEDGDDEWIADDEANKKYNQLKNEN
jgi:hypothetical protein